MTSVMNGENPAFTLERIGEQKSLSVWPKYLRYCPECASEDTTLFGETYWHRAHQLLGVVYCTKHLVRLLDSNVPVKRTTTNFFPASNENFIIMSSLDDDLVQYKNQFLKICKESEWLLHYGLDIDWELNRFDKYRRLLRDRKLSTVQGVSNYEAIDKAFVD